ncbi:TPA: ABC transporter permease subunit, partial [Candidatus Bathyarchaeota archaeon]|nr:ABC transporter permease subunit [Candidatus Bathyarchaeota archaeon]
MALEIIEGIVEAFKLISSGDRTVMEISTRSIAVSGTATLLSTLWGLPAGTLLGLREFRGKFFVKSFFNALLGVPTVALGLTLYLLFSKSGPLGFLRLLYTPFAMILGQSLLITPIMVSFTASAIESVEPEIKDLARTLGASEAQVSLTVLKEAISGVCLAVMASFNRAIAELGVALMLGGNIRGATRVLTTAIALETGRGEVALG